MAYNTYLYVVVFLGFTLLLYFVMPKKFRWTILLLASYIFYYIYSNTLIVYLLISTLSVYLAGIFLGRIIDGYESVKKTLPKEERKTLTEKVTRQKKLVVLITLLLNFGILAYLKYFNFFGDNINFILPRIGVRSVMSTRKIILPLGISFYTLQAISYVIDVYRGKCKADYNLGRIALFLSFFPQIVEGPIGRYDQLADQLYEGHSFDYKSFTFGGQLLIWGLFKKMVIADRANVLVRTVFSSSQTYSGVVVAAAVFFYTLQIYAEFSGCMDMVTGSAQMFGINLAKNFERPFFSKSVSEFWRRWHMTLGAWMRDYILYTSTLSSWFMKLNKKLRKHSSHFFSKLLPSIIPMLLVWLFCGIWHGASWKYVVYGLYYYFIMVLGMAFEPLFAKLFSHLKFNRSGKVYGVFQLIRTFILVNIGMLIFRAPQLKTAFSMFISIFTGFSLNALNNGTMMRLGLDIPDYFVLGGGALIIFLVGLFQEKGYSLRETISDKNIALRWCVYFAAIFAVIIFGAYGAGYSAVDFIYAQF